MSKTDAMEKRPTKRGLKPVTVWMTPEDHARLKAQAAMSQESLENYTLRGVLIYLERRQEARSV